MSCFQFNSFNIFNTNYLLRLGFRVATSANGVQWPEMTRDLEKKYDTFPIFDKNIEYPAYYLKDFHAYDNGNLNWRAAEEAMSATEGVLSFHYEHADGNEANDIVRGDFMKSIEKHVINKDLNMVDMACGIGYSTNLISENFNGKLVGIDLSPYFLSKGCEMYNIELSHQNVEHTNFKSNSQDIVFISYLLHELPQNVSKRVIREAHRILKKDGILGVLDMDPDIKSDSKFRQFIFDRTEPYLEEYKIFSKKRTTILNSIGFDIIEENDYIPKTSIFIARKL